VPRKADCQTIGGCGLIYFSYFAGYKKALFCVEAVLQKRVASIANYAPPGFRFLPTIEALAPGKLVSALKAGKISEDKYAAAYQEKLTALLEEGAFNWSDLDGWVLLCWEGPGKFCHRRLLAKFLADLGYEVNLDGEVLTKNTRRKGR